MRRSRTYVLVRISLSVPTFVAYERTWWCNLLEWKGRPIYKNYEPFADQLQPIYFTCNSLYTKTIGFKDKLSKVWRIVKCNPMTALLNQGCLNQWSVTGLWLVKSTFVGYVTVLQIVYRELKGTPPRAATYVHTQRTSVLTMRYILKHIMYVICASTFWAYISTPEKSTRGDRVCWPSPTQESFTDSLI